MKPILFSAILLLSTAVLGQAPATPAVALKEEPHHHLLFENDYVKAWAFGIAGHEATLLHSHDLPYLGVTVGSADFITRLPESPRLTPSKQTGR